MREPAFWRRRGAAAALLSPAAAVYGAIAAWRLAQPGWRAAVPVLCVGNFTLGGAGKTPAAIAIAKLAVASGHRPFFLSRGYGGRLAGPSQVSGHSAREVGDEALLLARTAPTVVARHRPAGAKTAAAAGASLIIMDDGLQNPSLAKNVCLAVVDGRRGIGNGLVFPAGPLRAPLAAQFDRLDALIVVGAASALSDRASSEAQKRGLRIFRGELRPDPAVTAMLKGKPALAFAGIGDPEKFFATLEACGIPAAVRAPFPDHHVYSRAEIATLLATADRERLALVTTEKDFLRFSGDPIAAVLAARTKVLPVTFAFTDPAAIMQMLFDALAVCVPAATSRERKTWRAGTAPGHDDSK